MIGIYKITSPTGKVYIGQSWNIKRRWNTYFNLKCKDQTKLYNSFIKHGIENHDFEIVQNFNGIITQMELNKYEQYYMDLYRCFNFELMNLKGAGGHGKFSEESKDKMRIARNKGIYQYSLSGELIKEWDSSKAAGKELGIYGNSINGVCRGKHKTAYGFIWKFK